MANCELDPIILDVPKLVKYGPAVSKRFIELPILRDRQKEALESLGRWFSEDHKVDGEKTKDYTAVVSMPTGTGKSGIICCLPYYLGGADLHCIDLAKPILVLAPGLNILQQLENDLLRDPFLRKRGLLNAKELPSLGYTVFSITKCTDVPMLPQFVRQYDIVLTNAQKWRKAGAGDNTTNYKYLPKNLFSVIIVDEAHHLPANQWEEIIDNFKEHAKIIFFTATPNRADGQEITSDGALTKVKYAYELSREMAIKDKIIREVRFNNISYDFDPEPTELSKKPKLDPGSETKEMQKHQKHVENMKFAKIVLVNVNERMKEKNRDSPLPRGKKHAAIIIAYNIGEAKEVERICKEDLHLKAKLVHSENRESAATINDKIKSGRYKVVIIVQMLLEGFDYPPLSIAGIVTRIRSPVKFSQFIGRVQRIVEVDGEAEEGIEADIITHEYFEQKDLIAKYENPVNPDTEDRSLDAEDAY